MLGLGLHISKSKISLANDFTLDTYSGAAVAYSLRNLTTSWEGQAVIRVRRTSDNAEQNFLSNEVRNGTLTSFVGAGDGCVTTIFDQSGNGRDVVQTTASKQPKIVSSGSLIIDRGKPAIQFDGDDDALVVSSFPYSGATSGCFLRVVSSDSNGLIWGVRTNGSNNRQWSETKTGIPDSRITKVNQTSDVEYISVVIGENLQELGLPQDIIMLFADGITDIKSYANGSDYIVVGATSTWFGETMLSGDTLQFGTKSDQGSVEVGSHANMKFLEFIYYPTNEYNNRADIYNSLKVYYT